MTQLRKAFDAAWQASERRSWIIGLLGRINADESVTLQVPGRPQFLYVRVGGRGETQSLTIANGFQGVDGLFRLEANGVAQRRFAILEVRKAGVQMIQPPPTVFAPVTN